MSEERRCEAVKDRERGEKPRTCSQGAPVQRCTGSVHCQANLSDVTQGVIVDCKEAFRISGMSQWCKPLTYLSLHTECRNGRRGGYPRVKAILCQL